MSYLAHACNIADMHCLLFEDRDW